MVRTGPDVQEDQRPEVHDRQTIGIDRAFRLLGHVVVHDAQEAGGQEETDRIVAVPPLGQGVLHPGEQGIALGRRQADRHRQVIDDVQHGDGDDERQEEPVGHIDMRLFAAPDGAQVNQQVNHPDHGQPQIDVPFRLGVFTRLGHAQDITRGRHQQEQLIAPEHEPGRPAAGQTGLTGALHDVERGHQQDVAAEGENHRRGVQRAQTAEVGPGQVEVQDRKCELQGDDQAGGEADDAPEG